eukprot:1700766-Pyramimonas_sp.AAC.1
MANREIQGASSSIPPTVSPCSTDEAANCSRARSECGSPETQATDGSLSWVGYDDELQGGSRHGEGADCGGHEFDGACFDETPTVE